MLAGALFAGDGYRVCNQRWKLVERAVLKKSLSIGAYIDACV